MQQVAVGSVESCIEVEGTVHLRYGEGRGAGRGTAGNIGHAPRREITGESQ